MPVRALILIAFSLSVNPLQAARRHVRGTVPLPKDTPNKIQGKSATPTGPSYRPEVREGTGTGAEETGDRNLDGGRKGRLDGEISKTSCDQKHSIETFVQIAFSSAPQASKKGGVYFLSDLREVPQVFYLKSPGNWPEQVSFFPDGVPYFQVSPDGEKILLATHDGGDEQYDIFLVEPGNHAKLTPLLVDILKRVESVMWAPSSKWFAFTSNARNKTDIDLYRFDLAKGQPELLAELKGHHRVSDISPNEKLIAYTNFRSVSDGDILVYDLATKQSTNLTKHSGDASYDDARFTADSKSLFYVSDVERGLKQLFIMPVDGSSRKLFTSEKWEVEDFVLDETRLQLAFVVNEDGYARLDGFLLDSSGRKGRALPVPKDAQSLVRSPSFGFGKNKRGFFYTQTSSINNSDVWFWQHPQKTQWTKSTHGQMRPECFTREKLVRYPSFDKVEIPGFLYYPRGEQGPVPFIVYVHGGPESQFRPTFSKIFQYFLERGFGVFAPNVRGSTGYGKQYTEMDNYRKRMDSVKDAIEGAKWLIANRYSKPGTLAIYGGSYGGFMVLRSIEVEPDLFAAACESVGISNFVTFLKNTKPYRRALREVEYGPMSDEEFLKSISPMTYLDKIKTPLLIFHGANDPRVPVSEAEQIIKELQSREVPVESKIFADEGHGNRKLRNIMEQARQTVYFFEKYMRKKP